MLFVSELQYGARNVDQSPSELLTSTPYVNCMSRQKAKPDNVSATHMYTIAIGKYEIASVFSHVL